jgi:hypothetical protein
MQFCFPFAPLHLCVRSSLAEHYVVARIIIDVPLAPSLGLDVGVRDVSVVVVGRVRHGDRLRDGV